MSSVAIVALFRAAVFAASLRWDAPPECPDAATVARRVLVGDHASQIDLQAVVTREPGGYRLRADLRSGEDRQQVTLSHAHGCDALVEKLVLYVAPLLDEPRSPAERPKSSFLRLTGVLDVGSLRTLTGRSPLVLLAGGTIAGGWRRGRLRVELGVPLVTGRTRAQGTDGFGELRIRWYGTGVQARGCGAFDRRNVELLACGELAIHLLVGDPRAVEGEFERNVTAVAWASGRLVLGAVWWMRPRVGLRLEAAPGVNLRPGERTVYDKIEGESARRGLVEIGLGQLAAGVGVDLRFGAGGPGRARP